MPVGECPVRTATISQNDLAVAQELVAPACYADRSPEVPPRALSIVIGTRVAPFTRPVKLIKFLSPLLLRNSKVIKLSLIQDNMWTLY